MITSTELLPLASALRERTEELVARSRLFDSPRGAFQSQIEDKVARLANSAVADRLEGSTSLAIQDEIAPWQEVGRLAEQRTMSLSSVARYCLRLRDSIAEIVRSEAERRATNARVLDDALVIVQTAFDEFLVKMCQSFENAQSATEEVLEQRQRELAFQATHDELTGLPNRTLIIDRIEQMVARAHRNLSPTAVVFIDVDNFKSVNDTLGHDAGDELLRAVASRLRGAVRESDTLGRLGGDEFVVVAEGMSLIAGPELVAERLLESLREPFNLAPYIDSQITVTASLGVTVRSDGSALDLLREADIAMYNAKSAGKNRFAVYESFMERALQSRLELEMDLHAALRDHEFFLVYQPIFDLKMMRPTGVEALVRWRHPTRGVVSPDSFLLILEETGMIHAMGRFVLHAACEQVSTWRDAGHLIDVSVNISIQQIESSSFVDDVRSALEATGLTPSALILDVTETSLMKNVDATIDKLKALKELGVRIALDNFGTGYSSLVHLERLPVDILKIDRSTTTRMVEEREGLSLLHALVQLGKALSIETVAGGIEDRLQLGHLQNEECDLGQGFVFTKPLEAFETETFLLDHRMAAEIPAAAI